MFTLPDTSTLPAAEIKPLVNKLPLVVLPVTVTEVNVPTEVMFGCAAVVTVPAVVADVAVVAVPTVNDAAVPVNPVPAPLNDDPVTAPVADINPPVSKLPPVTFADTETVVPV